MNDYMLLILCAPVVGAVIIGIIFTVVCVAEEFYRGCQYWYRRALGRGSKGG